MDRVVVTEGAVEIRYALPTGRDGESVSLFVGCVQTIENTFAKLKEFRAGARRNDKTDAGYTASIHLAAAIIALR